jgi:hypothetical protein
MFGVVPPWSTTSWFGHANIFNTTLKDGMAMNDMPF